MKRMGELQFKFVPLDCILAYMEQGKIAGNLFTSWTWNWCSPCTGSSTAGVCRERCRHSPSLALPPMVFTEGAAATVLTLALPPLVFAEGAADKMTVLALPPLVFAESAAATVLALALLPVAFAEGAAATVLALALLPLVFAESAAATVPALTLLPQVFAETTAAAIPDSGLRWLCSHLPPQSLHLLFFRLCSQRWRLLGGPACPPVFLFLPVAAITVPLPAGGAGGTGGGVQRLLVFAVRPACPPVFLFLPVEAITVPLPAGMADGAGGSAERLLHASPPGGGGGGVERLVPAPPPVADTGPAPPLVLMSNLCQKSFAGRACLEEPVKKSTEKVSGFTRILPEELVKKSPEKVSGFTTVPRSVSAWLWTPPVAGSWPMPALVLAGRACLEELVQKAPEKVSGWTLVPPLSQWPAGMLWSSQMAFVNVGKSGRLWISFVEHPNRQMQVLLPIPTYARQMPKGLYVHIYVYLYTHMHIHTE